MEPIVRHRLIFNLLRPSVALFARWKFAYTYDSLQDIEGPYLLLPNHNMELDPILVGAAAKKQLYFVASEHLTRKGFATKLLNFCFQPIIHQKGRQGAHTVKAMLKTLRAGHSVCLFPEGNRSFNGLTCAIPPATGKLAKKSGAKLVTYRFEGHYLTQPRWSTTLRRGKLRGKLVRIYTPEELQAMTDEQINEAIVRDLSEDAYETQSQEMVPFKGKKLAFGMESTIFACPKCQKIGTLQSDDTGISCTCGFRGEYDVYGYLHDGDTKYTITQLDQMQQTLLQTMTQTEGVLFSDCVTLQNIGENHEIIEETQGTVTAYADHLDLCGRVLPYEDILGMSIYSRNVLVLHTISDSLHYEIRGDVRFSALKYLYFFECKKVG